MYCYTIRKCLMRKDKASLRYDLLLHYPRFCMLDSHGRIDNVFWLKDMVHPGTHTVLRSISVKDTYKSNTARNIPVLAVG
jgi:hypothetical protein